MKLFLLLMTLGCGFAFGQNVQSIISNSGYLSQSQDVQLSWTIGELNVLTYSDNSTILGQGFQQTNINIVGLTSITSGLNISVYPNPFGDLINVNIDSEIDNEWQYELYSSDGKLILSNYINAPQKSVDLSDLAMGVYCMKILHKNSVQKTVRLIKTLK